MIDDDSAVPEGLTRHVLPGQLWIRGKELPVDVWCYYFFPLDGSIGSVEEMTDMTQAYYMDMLDRRSIVSLQFEDEHHNKQIFKAKVIEGIQVMAPKEMPADLLEALDRN